MGFADRIETLRNSHLDYVCLEGSNYLLAPPPPNTKIVFLTADARAMADMLGAKPHVSTGNSRALNSLHTVDVDSALPLNISIFQKSNDVFPQRFESMLLNNRVLSRNGLIHVPGQDDLFWAMLYRRLVHEGALIDDPEWRQIMLDSLNLRIGQIVKPKYRELGCWKA
jgi:hypothetical protein